LSINSTELYYFSYTGTCRLLATKLAKELKLSLEEIKVRRLPYAFWLVCSFVPGLFFPATFKTPETENIIVVFPKWTVNCPPVRYFLRYCSQKGITFKQVLLIITHRGFKELAYAKSYEKKFRKISKVVEVKLVKKDEVEKVLPGLILWAEKALRNS